MGSVSGGVPWSLKLLLIVKILSVQAQLSTLPGFNQWQNQLSQHSAAEGGSLVPQQQTQTISWQDQINRVKEAEDRLRQQSGQNVPEYKTFAQPKAPVFNAPGPSTIQA